MAPDRFWYERTGQFSPDQLLQLRQSSLSRIICDNADDISRVPRDAFVLQDVSEFADCSDLPSVNLDLWMDCQGQLMLSVYVIVGVTTTVCTDNGLQSTVLNKLATIAPCCWRL